MRYRPLFAGGSLPLVIEPSEDGSDLSVWATQHQQEMERLLGQSGALLFRGFDMDLQKFGAFSDSACGKRIDYQYRSAPRTVVGERIYTSTTYPANREILLHCENSYHSDWPLRLAFYSVKPALRGGETPIADMVRVTSRIPESLLKQFRDRGVKYVRNYHPEVDLPWTDVFQTHNKADVERMCREVHMDYFWLPDGQLRTSHKCQGTIRHPDTGQEILFNQAHLFHVSSVGAEAEKVLLEVYGMENLPRNAYYGDGEPIDRRDLDRVRSALDAESVAFTWQTGDVLLVDNMRVAHGRRPYEGARSVVVAMGSPYSKSGASARRAVAGA